MFHPQGPTFVELARQGLSSTERGYDLLAPKFDFTPFCTPEAIMKAVGERLALRAPFGDGLDLCCGTGVGVRMLRPLCTGRVVGLDFSEGMLAEARRRMMPTGAAQVQWERGDVLQLTYERAFDVVTCFGAFGHIPRAREPAFAAGILRALRPGGLFAFVSFSMPRAFTLPWLFGRTYNAAAHLRNLLVRPAFLMFYLTFTLDQARELLARSGFAVEVVRDILPAPYQRGALVLARRPK